MEKLAQAHFKKIEMSDAVYIVNIGGYIGENVRLYMRKLDKVLFLFYII